MKLRHLCLAALACAGSCAKPGDVGDINLHGAVQKGPFVIGSSIEVSLLDAQLNPTGQVFDTQTANDRGEFDVAFSATGPVSLKGVGFYYNEVTGGLSTASITLRAFYVPVASGAQTAFVNLITHLTTQRIMALNRAGTPFDQAVAQAERELRTALGITVPGFVPAVAGIAMNVAGGDDDNNAYLLAVSSVLTQVAFNKGGSIDANLQELLNGAAIDLEDGDLSAELKARVADALRTLDVRGITAKLAARLSEIGSSASVPDMNRVLDQDSDGVANSNDNCVLMHNPLQEDGDADGVGNACDACLSTPCPDECLPADPAWGRPVDLCYTSCGSCAAGEGCITTAAAGGTLTSLCAPPCDPLAAGTCGASKECFFSGGQGWYCAYSVLFGNIAEGANCAGGPGEPTGCGPRLACRPAPGNAWVCTRPCDPGDPSACGGLACVAAEGASYCVPPPGQADQGCDVSPSDTCASPLTCVDSSFGCPQGLDRCCKLLGASGQPCKLDRTCNTGLDCTMEGCPSSGGGGADGGGNPMPRECCAETGGLNQPCSDTTGGSSTNGCDDAPSLMCAMGPPGYCPNGASRCCKHAGEANEPCRSFNSIGPDGGVSRCNGDSLTCVTSSSCPGPDSCCLPSGGPGEPCSPTGACTTSGYACGTSATCTAAGLGQCCIPAGGDSQPCLPGQTCNDASLSCVSSMTGGNPTGVCGATNCCLLTGDLYQACSEPGQSCKNSSLGCGPAPAGSACLYGANRCCVPAGSENEPCITMGADGGTLAPGICEDATLSCLSSSSCPGGWGQCCLKAGELGQPCRNGTLSSQCSPGLACVWSSGAMIGTCVSAGALNEPCRPNTGPGTQCDPGLACSMNPSTGSTCIPAGGLNQICLDNMKCAEGYLACGSSASCPAGVGQCCHLIPNGAKDQPCGPGDSCNAGNRCVSIGCPSSLTPGGGTLSKCCEPPFPDCSSSSCSDSATVCITSSQCNPLADGGVGTDCCVPAGNAYQPCKTGNQCNSAMGDLLCTASTACPGGLATCCLAAGGIDQPCLAGGSCTVGFCGSSNCPNGLANCCQAAPSCTPQSTCTDTSRVCAFSSKCGSGPGGPVQQCCAPAGERNQACTAQNTCATPELQCIQDPTQCPDGLQACCLEPGAAGQPCGPSDTCNVGLTCFTGLPQGECRRGSQLSKCCLPSGTLGERCNADLTCDGGLACLYAWDTTSTSSCNSNLQRCCRAVTTGGVNQPCGAADACDSGLACVTSPMVLCGPGINKCCELAGGNQQPCKPGGVCDTGTCGSYPGYCLYGLSTCCG